MNFRSKSRADFPFRKQIRTTSVAQLTWHRNLRSLLEFLEGKVKAFGAGYCSARWLWYLRRLPTYLFEGNQPTTYTYDSALAEVASGMFGVGVDNARVDATSVKYSTDGAVAKRILNFSCAIQLMSQAHVLLRYAGKGVKFQLRRGTLFPEPIPTTAEQNAMNFYDSRNSNRQTPFSRAGTSLAVSTGGTSDEILTVLRMIPTWAPSLLASGDGKSQEIQVFAKFAPELVELNRLTELLSDPRLSGQSWIQPEVPSIFVLLHLGLLILGGGKHSIASVMQRGYVIVDAEDLRKLLIEHLPSFLEKLRKMLPGCPIPENGDAALESVWAVKGSLWPLRLGPILRRNKAAIWLDLYAATHYLDAALEFPHTPGQAIANARAEHFEKSTQSAIDATRWEPTSGLRDLLRRGLRLNGQVISDVDAIGAKGSTLLLVSCKSLIYSGAYDIGDYNVVRNAASTVEGATTYWNQVVGRLRDAPKGDNYDFTQFKELLPVVCTPHPVFVSIEPATTEIRAGLPAATSLEELVSWLQSN